MRKYCRSSSKSTAYRESNGRCRHPRRPSCRSSKISRSRSARRRRQPDGRHLVVAGRHGCSRPALREDSPRRHRRSTLSVAGGEPGVAGRTVARSVPAPVACDRARSARGARVPDVRRVDRRGCCAAARRRPPCRRQAHRTPQRSLRGRTATTAELPGVRRWRRLLATLAASSGAIACRPCR
jgi:hypothetical protein